MPAQIVFHAGHGVDDRNPPLPCAFVCPVRKQTIKHSRDRNGKNKACNAEQAAAQNDRSENPCA